MHEQRTTPFDLVLRVVHACARADEKMSCVVYCEQQFWKAIDDHNRSCERYIEKMSTVMEDKKVEERSLSFADLNKKYEDMRLMIADHFYVF